MAKKRKAAKKAKATRKPGAKKPRAAKKPARAQASCGCHSHGGPFKDVCGISAGV